MGARGTDGRRSARLGDLRWRVALLRLPASVLRLGGGGLAGAAGRLAARAPPALLAVIAGVAGAKVVFSLLGLFEPPVARTGPPTWVYVGTMLAFATSAGHLLLGGRADRRAVFLAVSFLLVATTFSDRLLSQAAASGSALIRPVAILSGIDIVAFLPFAMWSFMHDFPRLTDFGTGRRIAAVARGGSLALGFLLLASGAVYRLTDDAPASAVHALAAGLTGTAPGSAFWPITLVLTASALGYGIARAGRAGIDERRRVRLLTAGLLVGGAPILSLVTITELWPWAWAFVARPPVYGITQAIVYPFLLSIPFTTAYAVQVHQALDVRLYVRKAVQYGLARYTLLAGVGLPFLALGVLLYQGRHRTLADLLVGGPGPTLLLVALACGLGVMGRRRLLAAIDRRFFREQYDTRRILRDLVAATRHVSDVVALETLLAADIDRALHLESVAFLSRDAGRRALVSRTGGAEPLPTDSPLAVRLEACGELVDVDLERPGASLGQLTDSERAWLAAGGVRLLCPFLGGSGTLLAVLALGGKRSELPFTADDRSLLSAVAASAGAPLEHLLAMPSQQLRYATPPMGHECDRCGLVAERALASCPDCGQGLSAMPLPRQVGKFLIERRIGRGGMGVVYLATDVTLDRRVALKTLPRLAPVFAWRLRREARAMAAVTHPNLAVLLGTESWAGTPILVVEYLPGGTLANRLARGPFAPGEAMQLGIALADAVRCIHGAGILHRDIKPSNIGYTADGVPKLLDFGLARMLEPATASLRAPAVRGVVGGDGALDWSQSATGTGMIVGTVDYLSPEATDGAAPDPSFDLWSVAVVLYEAIAGRNPFRAASIRATLHRIYHEPAPDLREHRPNCPAPIAALFHELLSRDRRRRPDSAGALRQRLERTMERPLA